MVIVDRLELPTPGLVTALREQLGLKLDPETMPLDFLVIESAERPTEN